MKDNKIEHIYRLKSESIENLGISPNLKTVYKYIHELIKRRKQKDEDYTIHSFDIYSESLGEENKIKFNENTLNEIMYKSVMVIIKYNDQRFIIEKEYFMDNMYNL